MSIGEIIMFVFKDPHNEMIIDKTILEKITDFGTIPILWCRDGEYCIVPSEEELPLVKRFRIIEIRIE